MRKPLSPEATAELNRVLLRLAADLERNKADRERTRAGEVEA